MNPQVFYENSAYYCVAFFHFSFHASISIPVPLVPPSPPLTLLPLPCVCQWGALVRKDATGHSVEANDDKEGAGASSKLYNRVQAVASLHTVVQQVVYGVAICRL